MHIRNLFSPSGFIPSLGATVDTQTDRSSESSGQPTQGDAGSSAAPRANIRLLLTMLVTIVVCAACGDSGVSNGGGTPSSDWGAMKWNQDVWG